MMKVVSNSPTNSALHTSANNSTNSNNANSKTLSVLMQSNFMSNVTSMILTRELQAIQQQQQQQQIQANNGEDQSNRKEDTSLDSVKAEGSDPGSNENSKEALKMIYSNQYNETNNCNSDISNGKITLWQFLLELLFTPQYNEIIRWTNTEGEFVLIQAEEVAKLWGLRKDKNHRMNYDKLSRALRYYYQKNIIKKVHGHKFVYQFSDWKTLMTMHKQQISNGGLVIGSGGDTENQTITTNLIQTLKRKASPERVDSPPDLKIPTPSPPEEKKPQPQPIMTQTAVPIIENKSGNLMEFWLSLFENLSNCISNNNTVQLPIEKTLPIMSKVVEKEPPHRSSTPNCNCSCHGTAQIPFLTTSPPPEPKIRPQREETQNFSENGVQLHHKRHTINMQRLTEQILLHSRQSVDNPSSSPTTNSLQIPEKKRNISEDYDDKNRKPINLSTTSRRAVSEILAVPTLNTPVTQDDQNSNQNCVWMPVPIGMLNQWTSMLNT